MKSLLRTSSGPWAWLLASALLFAAGPGCDRKAHAGGVPSKIETFTNTVGMTFVKIPEGRFMMGPEIHADEKLAHSVAISRPFFLQATEVTQGQWKAVMGTEPWKGKKDVREGGDYPAAGVSWEEAQEFCLKLSAKEGKAFRLPTEAEWEYACRAGTTTKYSFGDDEGRLGDHAWFDKNADEAGDRYAHRVGTKRPNPWGLHDMHGNVWEWCQDWYGPYARAAQTDPAGLSGGELRVIRGGSWDFYDGNCCSAYRGFSFPDNRDGNLGFRVVLAAPGTP